jgi:hypothetical protein
MRLEPLKRLLTPLVSLAGGLMTLFLLRRGIGFAPFSLGIAVMAWISAALFSRYFDEAARVDAKRHQFWRWLSRSFVVGLYQNVLFFLLPVWFGSAELFSGNIVFPILLSAIALVACFDDHFSRRVLEHPTRRTIASAVLLFSVSVPALSLQNLMPLRLGAGLCAAVTTFAAVVFGLKKGGGFKTLSTGLLWAGLLGVIFYFISFLLPPVPIQCVTKAAAAGIEKRKPVGIAKVFPAGTPKIHVHFSVAAPERFQQKIRFRWYVNGEKRGRPIPSSIAGGRKRGFRTWTYRSDPKKGAYRVDLETNGGQLIGRVRFRVR